MITLMSVIVAFTFAIALWYYITTKLHCQTVCDHSEGSTPTMLALVNGGTFDSATGGTFQSDTDGTFNSDIPGTFESDMGGTFKVLQSNNESNS